MKKNCSCWLVFECGNSYIGSEAIAVAIVVALWGVVVVVVVVVVIVVVVVAAVCVVVVAAQQLQPKTLNRSSTPFN